MGCDDISSSGAAGPVGDGKATPLTVSFKQDVLPIFQAKCNACHYRGGAVSVYLDDPFDPKLGVIDRENDFPATENRIMVAPGKPEESFLIDKVTAETLDKDIAGDVMPYIFPPITEAEREAVRTWIEDGAKDDAFFRDEVAPIFGTALKLDERGGKCVWCHSAKSSYPPNLLDPFDPKLGVVNVKASRGGGLRVVPGDADASLLYRKISGEKLAANEGEPMPAAFERLTDEEVDTLEAWIREGARNN